MNMCPECEAEFPDAAEYCMSCGTKLNYVSYGTMKLAGKEKIVYKDGEMVGLPDVMGYVTDIHGNQHEVLKGEPVHDSLSPDQLTRISCLRDVLREAYPMTLEGWIEGFICGRDPEKEIRLIEAAAVVYQELTEHAILEKNEKELLYGIITCMSFGRPHIYRLRWKVPHGFPDVDDIFEMFRAAYESRKKPKPYPEAEPELSTGKRIETIIISDDDLLIGKLQNKKADLLISLGDVLNGTIQKAIDVYGCKTILAVRGNHDNPGLFPDGVEDLHLRQVEIAGIKFGGFSGSWRYKSVGHHMYEQEEVIKMMEGFPPVDVFIAHNSPRGIHEMDDDVHQGFDAFLDYIDRVQPQYFIHGHQHLNRFTIIKNTTIVSVIGEIALELQLNKSK